MVDMKSQLKVVGATMKMMLIKSKTGAMTTMLTLLNRIMVVGVIMSGNEQQELNKLYPLTKLLQLNLITNV